MSARLKNRSPLSEYDPEKLAVAFAESVYSFNARHRLESLKPENERSRGGILTRKERYCQKLLNAMEASQALVTVSAVRELGILTGAPYSDATFELLDRCHAATQARLQPPARDLSR